MTIRFLGLLPLGWTIALAVVVCLLMWFVYRRESRRGVEAPLSWLLPLLRTLALLLLLLTLAGPVLRHRYTEGELGNVVLLIDGSESMSLNDKGMPLGQKLVIATRQGWLKQGTVDERLLAIAQRIVALRTELRMAIDVASEKTGATRAEQLSRESRRLAGIATAIGQQLQQLEPPASRLTKPEQGEWRNDIAGFRDEVVAQLESAANGKVDELAANQVVDSLLRFESRVRFWFERFHRHITESADPAIQSALANFDGRSRWSRVESELLDTTQGIVEKLVGKHRVQIVALRDSEAIPLWDSQTQLQAPEQLAANPDGQYSDLSTALQRRFAPGESLDSSSDGDSSSKGSGISGSGNSSVAGDNSSARTGGRTALVLLSDGQANSGPIPREVAAQLGARKLPLYTVGIASNQEPQDAAVLAVQHPKTAFRGDSIRGTITLKDRLLPGTSYQVEIAHGDRVVWKQALVSDDVMDRRVRFEFPLEQIVENELAENTSRQKNRNSITVQLDCRIVPIGGESRTDNNRRTMRIKTTIRERSILLVDGRSRWEFRYLRNLIERDKHWSANSIVVGPGTDQATLRRGKELGMFPPDRAGLYDYDVIVLGEVAQQVLTSDDQKNLRDFVGEHGGGIIFIDGHRRHLRQLDADTLLPLVPVSWKDDHRSAGQLPQRIVLTPAGTQNPALMLVGSAEENKFLWSKLPPPKQPVLTEVIPGAEVLAALSYSPQQAASEQVPLLVTRRFGAGRVLYCSADETWRWRFKNADVYHQRYWNQVANWVMEMPFTISDDYLSLDTDAVSYQAGDSAVIRARLRDGAGKPVLQANAEAVLWQGTKVAGRFSLVADENQSGVFRAKTDALPAGSYQLAVEAAGYNQQALQSRLEFAVEEETSDELTLLGGNPRLLQEMAQVAGGRYFSEAQYQDLIDELDPYSSGKVIETETVLWDSYWWFAAVMLLLSLEWWLRKRAGLL